MATDEFGSAIATLRREGLIPGDETPGALQRVHDCFGFWLYLPDKAVIDVTLATYIAHKLGGDPVWVQLIAPPGSGKTEVLMSLRPLPGVHVLSSLTAQTFASGMKGKSKRAPSLLLRLQEEGKDFLVMKDFTSTLEMRREARGEILAQLREIYDGVYTKEFGTGDTIAWAGRLGFIAGVTPVIDERRVVTALLGERFVYYRLPVPSRREVTAQAREGRGHEVEMRGQFQDVVQEYMSGLDFTITEALSEAAAARVDALADFTTQARTGVDRDRYHRELTTTPEFEAPTRFVKQIESLAMAFRVMGYSEELALSYVGKVAESSIPRNRLAVLRELRASEGEVEGPVVGDKLGLESNTANRVLGDLAALKMVVREAGPGGRGGSHRWSLAAKTHKLWDETEGGATLGG
jgi:hypothetical protein